MVRLARSASAATAVVVLLQSAAMAVPLSNAEAKCQKAAGIQSRVLVKKRFKALQKCHDAVYKGKLPSSTVCTLNPTAAAKITKANSKFTSKIEKQCPDSVVTSLDFGGQCLGVTTGSALAACLLREHNAAADKLVSTAYPASTPRKCFGGPNDGRYCSAPANCPGGGVCALPGRACAGGSNDGGLCTTDANCPGGGFCLPNKDQVKCAKGLAGVIGKQADKRMSTIQKCKAQIAKGKLPPNTDCVLATQAKLAKLTNSSIAKATKACPSAPAATEIFGGACGGADDPDSLAACGTCSADGRAEELIVVQHGNGSTGGGNAAVFQIANAADCVEGPQSRCRVGDYLLANDVIRVVVQDVQRNYLGGIGQFGGQIIDADLVRTIGDDRDSFEEWSVSLNIESTAHYTNLTVLNDGSNGGPAVLRATGVDDLLDLLNPSSVIADFGFLLPPTVDDFDIPVTVQTDYILDPGASYVRVETTVLNTDPSALTIFFGEFLNGSGQIELFQSGYGFGEPLVTSPCSNPKCNRLANMVAWAGELESEGVSYAYVTDIPGSSTFTTSGVTVPQLGVDVLSALIGAATANFTMAPNGQPGDSLTFKRMFVVGDGTVSSLVETRMAAQCTPRGTINGTVDVGGSPVAGADIAVLSVTPLGPGGAGLHPLLSRNVVNHTTTDAAGNYSLTLPPGNYNVVANLDGSPFEGGGGTPIQHPVTVPAFGSVTQDITLPLTGTLRVTVVDENSDPIAARVSVVGFDPSPDPLVTQTILGLINNRTGVFSDQSQDGFPFGVAFATFADASGDTGDLPLEPGSYRVYVSHGTEYSIDYQDVTITAGGTTTFNGVVEHVIDTTGFVSGDFHVHSIDSPDASISRIDRVNSMLGEGVDFFAATDHDFRADFTSTLANMGVSHLLTTAVGQEMTTFDYGHFNAWPLDLDPSVPNNGFVDHGGAAPPGLDYPSAGYYSEPPANIVAMAHAAYSGTNTVQVNHIHSFFGVNGGSGLAIDTGQTPPTSGVPAAARRLDPLVTNYFTDTFDGLEIWIGDDRGQILNNFLGQNAGDWFNLLNQGIISTGIANSDTHRRFITQSGFPRTMVASPTDDPGAISQDDMAANVNAGRAIGTNGPMVRVTAHATSTGESGGLDLGRCTGVVPCTDISDCPPCTDTSQCGVGETCTALPTLLTTSDGNVDIRVDVQSPTWARFDKIEFYVNSATIQSTQLGVQTGAGTINVNRYGIAPDYVHTAGVDFTVSTVPAPGTGSDRLEASTTLSLTGLSDDVWVVVMVSGTDGVSEPLFPVVPNSITAAANPTLAHLLDGNLGENGITARAFTNPVFVDADGVPGWQAPGVQIAP